MSEPHTPGPWKIFHGGLKGDDGFSVGSDNLQAERVKVVAECWPCTIVDNQHRDELRANARLIEAAPELLAACEAARREIIRITPRGEVSLVIDRIDAVIEKAKGGEG